MVVVVKVAVVGSCCWFGFRCTEGEEGVKKEKIKKNVWKFRWSSIRLQYGR